MQSYIISFLILIFSGFVANCQKQISSASNFDTTNLIVRVCQGDLPGQKKDLTKDYYAQVCAYTYNKKKLVTYTVTGFQLIYCDSSTDSTDFDSTEGNLFSPKMRHMILEASDKRNNLFFDNVVIANRKGEKLVIRGRRPLITQK